MQILGILLLAARLATGKSALPDTGPTVAIIPTFDGSGQQSKKTRAEQLKAAGKELETLFTSRHFNLIPADVVDKALKDQQIDVRDSEQRTKEMFAKLGSTLHADYVFFAMISGGDSDSVSQAVSYFSIDNTHEKVKLKVWLIDSTHGKAILSSRIFVGEGKNNQVTAVTDGVSKALQDFLKDFPLADPKASGGHELERPN